MAEPNRDQVAELSAQLSALEGESQRLLSALQWSSTVRNILLLCLVLFVVVFGWLYYTLSQDIRTRKLEEFKTILADQQHELLEPFSREAFKLAEDVGPEVLQVLQKQVEKDGQKYVNAFNAERDVLTKNLEVHVDESVSKIYERLLDDHEKILQEEFPELNTEGNRTKLRANMSQTYRQLVKRYYIDYFHKEIERMALAIDNFPTAEPDESKGPLAQQVLYELMEMIQMMMVGPSDDLNLNAARESFSTPNTEAPSTTATQASDSTTKSDGGQ
jgi:hypothetical protein